MKKVDIVVPIYNAYEYTEECIKSILKYTDLNEHTLLLINDKSPDERIMPMLQKYAKENQDKNIVVLENDENSGFVKTVNRGMRYSNNDVLLLNSDTEVTKNWLNKIINCAYSNEYIATVTALTNNGTIASVPNFGVDNELPKNVSLDEYAEIIEKCSRKRYPELTTGNGFCMYIKRNVLDEIGYFDDVTFEKGYGEENDFCYRALDYGYINVLCDDTFVYHKGTQSFKKENLTKTRAEIIESHMELLRNKYPLYTAKTDKFIMLNPLKDIGENIRINTLIYNKKRVLFLVNEWEEDMEMTGGTSLHLKDIILGIKNNTACFVLSPNKNDLSKLKLFLCTEDFCKEIFEFKTEIDLYGQITYTNTSYKEVLEKIIDTFKIDTVHVHHFLFQTFDLIDIVKEKDIKSIITLHDLYMKCPSVNMVYENKYCELNKTKDCAKCLKSKMLIENNIIDNWQRTSENVLEKFDKIIVPSKNTKEQYNKLYKNLQIDVIEHGVDLIDIESIKNKDKKTFDIAFVGAMAPHKGSNILKNVIKANKNSKLKIHLFGKSEDEELRKNKSNYINHGPYVRGELPKLLVNNNIDLVCILTNWPETYSYTLSETYMAKIPVLTFDLGAVGDRVKEDRLGYVIPYNENEDIILQKINQIIKNTKEYNGILDNFKNYKPKTTAEMQKEYVKIYETAKLNKEEADLTELRNIINKYREIEMVNFMNQYNHVINKYENMRNTKIWELAKKIKLKMKGK